MTNKDIIWTALSRYENQLWENAMALHDLKVKAEENEDDDAVLYYEHRIEEIESLAYRVDSLAEKYN